MLCPDSQSKNRTRWSRFKSCLGNARLKLSLNQVLGHAGQAKVHRDVGSKCMGYLIEKGPKALKIRSVQFELNSDPVSLKKIKE